MDTLLNILSDIDPTIDWENEENIIMRNIIDSFQVINIISEIENCFNITIVATDITMDNFYSVKTIYDLICSKVNNEN